MKFSREELETLVVATVTVVALVFLATLIPFESFLSYYPFLRVPPWYVYWRASVAAVLIWVVALTFASPKQKFPLWVMWISAIVLALSHYWMLLTLQGEGVSIKLLPLLVVLESKKWGGTYILDIAQVAIAVTAIQQYFILRKGRSEKEAREAAHS